MSLVVSRSSCYTSILDLSRCCARRSSTRSPAEWSQRHARYFSRSAIPRSGHSKWASIKHDKGKADAARSKQRAILVRDISNAVKSGGPDPNMNPRLAVTIATAKKNAVPKAAMEAAIARGQGLSETGAALEHVIMEAVMPPNVAVVIECQTDARLKTLADLRLLIKEAGGNVSTVGYMFEKRGRIVLAKKEGMGVDEILEPALDAGALDVEEDREGRIVLWTEPAQTKPVAETLAAHLELDVDESEIVYNANEDTLVPLSDAAVAADLGKFLDLVSDTTGLQGVYLNWAQGDLDDAQWAQLQSRVP